MRLTHRKAYAKHYGCYELLEGGHVHAALIDMTGGSARMFALRDSGIASSVDTSANTDSLMSGALWSALVEACRSGALIAAGSKSALDWENDMCMFSDDSDDESDYGDVDDWGGVSLTHDHNNQHS
jgi:hypothetical protein